MARRQVVQITCDRCQRVETRDEGSLWNEGNPELTVTFRGELTTYEDLCRSCLRAVTNYHSKLVKKEEDAKDGTQGSSTG